jgi:hypothetical protein
MRKIARLFLTVFFVLVVFFLYVQQDPWLTHKIEQQIDLLMSQMCECRFHADVAGIDIIGGCITLKNCSAVHPTDAAQWSWQAKTVSLVWSWKDLLSGRKCSVACLIHNVACYSQVKKNDAGAELVILPHLILLTAPPAIDIPFVMNRCSLSKGCLDFYEVAGEKDSCAVHLVFAGEVVMAPDAAHITARAEKGSFSKGLKNYVEDGAITTKLSVPYTFDNGQQVHYSFGGACTVCGVPQKLQSVKLQGDGVGGEGVCLVSNEDRSLYGQFTFKNGTDIAGSVSLPLLGGSIGDVAVAYDHAQKAVDIDVPHITIAQFLQGVTSLYKAHAKVTPHQIEISCTSSNNHNAELVCAVAPEIKLNKFHYRDGQTELMTCSGTQHNFSGDIPYVTVRRLTQLAGFELQGTGACYYSGALLPTGVRVDFDMPEAHIRVPMTYSVIQKVSGQLQADWASRLVTLRDGVVDIYKGKMLCSQATVVFDEKGAATYVHLPLILKKCFFGWRKDFFAQISATCMVSYTKGKEARLEGSCIIDQAHIRGNPLSAEFQHDFFESALSSLNTGASSQSGIADDVVCDISYATKTPLEIKTPFLEASLACEGQCTGTLAHPHITGKLEFLRGVLEFPYKPLFITKGTVTIRPEALDDPRIDLIARNHIKKYDVELAITGTVRHPTITFSSSPHLEQANIITLLLGGSEDGSLYFLMPKVMTDTLETLLFGSVETSSRVQKYLKALFHPLKRVSLMPRLSDQAGRGGVRGVLSVEVNDRLRAMIEKNVSLPEDTIFEVEYDISDDSRFRLTRDERGDLGLEGEMRWKF